MKKFFGFLIVLGLVSFGITQNIQNAFAQGEQLKPIEVDGTEWNLTLTYTPEQGKAETSSDTIYFKDMKFVSVNYDKAKYSSTNYTLFVKDDGSTVFETMQTKDDDAAFWHGAILNGEVRGVLSSHAKGKIKDFTFTGKLVGGALNKVREAAPVPKAEEPEPAAAPAQAQ